MKVQTGGHAKLRRLESMMQVDQIYSATVEWLYARQGLGIQPGLGRIEALLDALDRPETAYATIHVAGTNGKGSVAALLAAVLEGSGHRTALYTSPHLVRLTERIRVGDREIPQGEVVRIVRLMRPIIDDMDRSDESPTFFEICTAMAFVHFRDQSVDWAVIEAGMGGRSDATNVIRPELCAITNIGLDHSQFLGSDLVSVAREKAGIVKEGVPLVTGAEGAGLDVLRQACVENGSPLVAVGEDYRIETEGASMRISDGSSSRTYRVAMEGAHQQLNAGLVVAASDVLSARGVPIAPEAISDSLGTVTVPGRLESIQVGEIRVVLDGAHNPAATEAVARHLRASGERFDLIVGFNRDKQWIEMMKHLLPLASRVWGIPVRSPRTLDPAEIGSVVPEGVEFVEAHSFEDAWTRLVGSGKDADVLVTGSLFIAGEARAFLTGEDLSNVGGSQ